MGPFPLLTLTPSSKFLFSYDWDSEVNDKLYYPFAHLEKPTDADKDRLRRQLEFGLDKCVPMTTLRNNLVKLAPKLAEMKKYDTFEGYKQAKIAKEAKVHGIGTSSLGRAGYKYLL